MDDRRDTAHLVQLFLPIRGTAGARPREPFDRVRRELAERFGGSTAYLQAPAAGLWEDEDGDVQRDEVVLIEVQVEALDRAWWRDYRATLERRFDQEEILVRALPVERL